MLCFVCLFDSWRVFFGGIFGFVLAKFPWRIFFGGIFWGFFWQIISYLAGIANHTWASSR
jgi:hypothetical protein